MAWENDHPEWYAAYLKKYNKAYRSKYPERRRAAATLRYHLKKGTIVKPKRCEDCGKEKPLHGHHPDYSKPLDVKWLCALCHKCAHWHIRHPEL